MSPSQQYLNTTDMRTIAGALARVRSIYEFEPGSADERQVAAIMIGEFQLGNATEDGLLDVFRRLTGPALHTKRKHHLLQSLQRWENEGRTLGSFHRKGGFGAGAETPQLERIPRA